MERDLRTMLGLASPEDPEPVIPAQEPPKRSIEEPQNPTQDMEPAASSRPVPNLALEVPNPGDPPAQPSNDMQIDQPNVTPIVALPQSQTPTKGVAPAKFSEGKSPVSEPQLPSWNPVDFIGDEEEEEEEIPSINMDSDSD